MQTTILEKNKSLLQKGFLGILMVSVISFVGCKLYPIIHGPTIDITTLINGSSVQDAMIQISGTASFTQELMVNGKNLALSPNGSFDEKLVLNPGYNVINIQGIDRFGKTSHKTFSLMLNEENPTTLTMNAQGNPSP